MPTYSEGGEHSVYSWSAQTHTWRDGKLAIWPGGCSSCHAKHDDSPDPWYPLERTNFQSLSSNLQTHSHNPKTMVFKNESLCKAEQLFPEWYLNSSRWTECCNSYLLALDCSFTESMSEYTINKSLGPYLPGPSSVSSLSLDTLVILSLALGRAATFVTAGQYASYFDVSQDDVPFVIVLLQLRLKSHHIQGWKLYCSDSALLVKI